MLSECCACAAPRVAIVQHVGNDCHVGLIDPGRGRVVLGMGRQNQRNIVVVDRDCEIRSFIIPKAVVQI